MQSEVKTCPQYIRHGQLLITEDEGGWGGQKLGLDCKLEQDQKGTLLPMSKLTGAAAGPMCEHPPYTRELACSCKCTLSPNLEITAVVVTHKTTRAHTYTHCTYTYTQTQTKHNPRGATGGVV